MVISDVGPFSVSAMEALGITPSTLPALGINPDKIYVQITHVHEDHVAGLLPLLKWLQDNGLRINLIIEPGIYEHVKALSATVLDKKLEDTFQINLIPAKFRAPLLIAAGPHTPLTIETAPAFHGTPTTMTRFTYKGRTITHSSDHTYDPRRMGQLRTGDLPDYIRADLARETKTSIFELSPEREKEITEFPFRTEQGTIPDLIIFEAGTKAAALENEANHTTAWTLTHLPPEIKSRMLINHTNGLPEGVEGLTHARPMTVYSAAIGHKTNQAISPLDREQAQRMIDTYFGEPKRYSKPFLLIGKPFDETFQNRVAKVLGDLRRACPDSILFVAEPQTAHITLLDTTQGTEGIETVSGNPLAPVPQEKIDALYNQAMDLMSGQGPLAGQMTGTIELMPSGVIICQFNDPQFVDEVTQLRSRFGPGWKKPGIVHMALAKLRTTDVDARTIASLQAVLDKHNREQTLSMPVQITHLRFGQVESLSTQDVYVRDVQLAVPGADVPGAFKFWEKLGVSAVWAGRIEGAAGAAGFMWMFISDITTRASAAIPGPDIFFQFAIPVAVVAGAFFFGHFVLGVYGKNPANLKERWGNAFLATKTASWTTLVLPMLAATAISMQWLAPVGLGLLVLGVVIAGSGWLHGVRNAQATASWQTLIASHQSPADPLRNAAAILQEQIFRNQAMAGLSPSGILVKCYESLLKPFENQGDEEELSARLKLLQEMKPLGFGTIKVSYGSEEPMLLPLPADRQARQAIVRQLRRSGIKIMDRNGVRPMQRRLNQFLGSV